jgi:hypothetical protein
VKLGRRQRVSGTDATATPDEAETGHWRGAIAVMSMAQVRQRESRERNRGQARGRLLENACRGRVHDGVRERGGGYMVVGKADERGPLHIDCRRDGRMQARGCGWQGGPTDKGRGGARADRAGPRAERAGRGETTHARRA